MSADNGIYILGTTESKPRIDPETGYQNGCDYVRVYRIAHTQAIDTFDYYERQNLPMLGIYMKETWGESAKYRTKESALEHAGLMKEEIGYLEYGISVIERFDYNTDFFYDYDIVWKDKNE